MGDLKNELQKMLEELELRKKKLSSLDFKQNQYVVLFKPVKGEGDLYGVTKKPLNKISSDIQDVLPVPGLEIIKVMGYTEALLQASKYSTIQVGDTTYKSFRAGILCVFLVLVLISIYNKENEKEEDQK